MSGIFDFHSHVLPRVDDGSDSLETSLSLLKQEGEQGIRHVVATPHFYPNFDSPEHFLQRRNAAEERLREELEKQADMPALTVGAEVYFFSGISDSDILPELTIGKKHCILIEMPQPPWTESMYRELEEIYKKQGITPIIAHVDRYIGPFHTFGIPKRLARLPVLVQANAEFFLDRATARMAMRMLREDQIHLLGSDCHDLKHRKPNLGEALERIRSRLGEDALNRIESYQQHVLQD